jgi:hypothetical protein
VNDWQVVVDKPFRWGKWRSHIRHDGTHVPIGRADAVYAFTHDRAHRKGMKALRRVQEERMYDTRYEVVYDSSTIVSN